jgi:hypothetical protein
MNRIALLVPCFASCIFLAHCTDDDSMSDATGGTQSSGGSVNGGTSSGGASGAGNGGQSGSAGSEVTGGSGGSGQGGASGSAGLGGTGQGGGAGDGGEGASGGASACEPETGDGACKECMRESCCDEVAPCDADEGCSACVQCVDEMGDLGACAVGNMPPCPIDATTNPGPSQDMLLCLLNSCESECGFN